MTLEILQALSAEAHRLREQGDAVAAESKEMSRSANRMGLSPLERAYFLLFASSKQTLAIAFHSAAREIEDGIKALSD